MLAMSFNFHIYSRNSYVNLSQDSCDKIEMANWACISSENDANSTVVNKFRTKEAKASLIYIVIFCMLIYCSFIYNEISPGAVISILTVGLYVGRMFMAVSCVVLFVQHYSLSTDSTEKEEKEFNILKEVRKDFGSTAPSDISFVKEHLSRYAKHIYFLRVSNAQMTHVNRTQLDREPSRITKRQLPHVFSKARFPYNRSRRYRRRKTCFDPKIFFERC